MSADVRPWLAAWTDAATGPLGFYRSASGRAEDHFATNVSDNAATAHRIVEIASASLARLLAVHEHVTITDVGAGAGTLIAQLALQLDSDVARRVHWRAIDVRPRPPSVASAIEWLEGDAMHAARTLAPSPGLVIAHELLDDLPCDVLEVDDDGRLRTVLVDARSGREELGDVVAHDEWCDRWWTRREPAARVEVGRSRDEAWQAVAGIVSDGVAIAVDYGHTLEQRESGLWDAGTLAAYRDGRLVPVIPDGTCNITAHVSMDSCAASVAAKATHLRQSRDGLWWLIHEMGR